MSRSKRNSTSKQSKGVQATQASSAAARQRRAQRRRQQVLQQVRRFEAVLPDGAGRVRPTIGVPAINLRPVWGMLRSRWLWTAGLVLAAVTAALVWVHSDERFFLYTEDAQFNGLNYLDRDELWKLSAIDGWNVFWLDTEAARERLLQEPYVEDAVVSVAPLVGKVVVDITEARPVALWTTDPETTLWLLKDGTALAPRGETPEGLLTITDLGASATAPGAGPGTAINPEVLVSAQGLLERLPTVAQLRYNRQIGLNFQLPDKPYWVYWGDGADVERKLENLAASLTMLEEGPAARIAASAEAGSDDETKPSVIDVRFARPYVK